MASVSGEDFAPRTFSCSRMTLAGLKKWVPTTSSGRPVAEAISVIERVEVLDARMAPGCMTASSLAKTCFLTSMDSNTASTTMSASAMSE